MTFLSCVTFQTVAECVLFYYLTKKNENYKNIVRRNYRRRGRSQVLHAFQTKSLFFVIARQPEQSAGVSRRAYLMTFPVFHVFGSVVFVLMLA